MMIRVVASGTFAAIRAKTTLRPSLKSIIVHNVWNASYEQQKEAQEIAERLKELLAMKENKKSDIQRLQVTYTSLTGEPFDENE
jgi:hypothetical protein